VGCTHLLILVTNFGTFRINNPHGWTSDEFWEAIITIAGAQAGVARETITESNSFVNDLGLD
jgi:hypothetical protein